MNRWLLAMLVGWAATAAAGERAPTFWDTWSDGKAEIDVYFLRQPRYGELRQGKVVLIYVAEPHLRSTRLKPDPGRHPETDITYVLKQVHLREFQTGVYPYCVHSTAFLYIDPEGGRPRGSVSKVSFASREWCGVTFHRLLFHRQHLESTSFSYFDGEGDRQERLDYPEQALVGDALYTALRGILRPVLAPGQCRSFPYLPQLARVRLDHKPLAWSRVKVTRRAEQLSVTVPAGQFQVERYDLEFPERPGLSFYVEVPWPHRVVGWEGADGEKAELVSSNRLKYWEMKRVADEALLPRLGL